MKPVYPIFLILVSCASLSAQKYTPDEMLGRSYKSFFDISKFDNDITGNTWYIPKYRPYDESKDAVYFMFARNGDKASDLRLRIQHRTSERMYAQRYIFIVDGKEYPLSHAMDNAQAETRGFKYDWKEIPITDEHIPLLNAFMTAKKVQFKVIGDRTFAVENIKPGHAENLAKTLDYYRYFGGAPAPMMAAGEK